MLCRVCRKHKGFPFYIEGYCEECVKIYGEEKCKELAQQKQKCLNVKHAIEYLERQVSQLEVTKQEHQKLYVLNVGLK